MQAFIHLKALFKGEVMVDPAVKNRTTKKSGMKTLTPGEVLFNENDVAESLFIIQKGQLRLFSPKGRGFVEIAILRAGEVIGEMAYFDEKSSLRSCSAAAITTTEVIEISFQAFAKTMNDLNPWFKTIINTLADRLRMTNQKLKKLECNSVGVSKGGKPGEYIFLSERDAVNMLGVTYMCLKSHGRSAANRICITLSQLKYYALDVFNLSEVKFEEFVQLLEDENVISIVIPDGKTAKLLFAENVEYLGDLLTFFNNQKRLTDDKKNTISEKCEILLAKIIEKNGMDKIAESKRKNERLEVRLCEVLNFFKERNIPIREDDYNDAIKLGIADEIMVGEDNCLTSSINCSKLIELYFPLKMINAIKRLNMKKEKSTNTRY